LRWSNTRLDNNTKKRYHQELQRVCPVPTPPDEIIEAASPTEADSVYQSWTKYLISQTRDKKNTPYF
jgi:hypothetical protein